MIIPGILSVGDKVHYLSSYPDAVPENGIVKSIHPNREDAVFVVYHCGGDWDNYQNYTAALTPIENLHFGWS